MKKLTTLAILPVIALASCSKNQEVKVEDTTTPDNTSQTQEVKTENTTNTEILNENVAKTTTDTENAGEVNFEFIYEIQGNKVPVKWKYTLTEGKVSDISIDGANTTNPQTPIDKFAVWVWEKVIWKELKWLKIDTVSWASYVTEWFNQFLSTLK